ncbi:hypothetical protein VPH35_132055 [Triticum aestivum]
MPPGVKCVPRDQFVLKQGGGDGPGCHQRRSRRRSDSSEEGASEVDRIKMGLEWMLKPASSSQPEGSRVKKPNPKEMNAYLRDNGTGYPDEATASVVVVVVVGWRLKALKLAKGQAACEGRNSEEVVEERWGSLGQLAASVSTYRVASSYAHLQSIRGRKAGQADNSEKSFEVDWKEDRQGVSSRDHAMRKLRSDSVPWKKNRHNISSEDQTLISSALASINKFAHDGSFMEKISTMMFKDTSSSVSTLKLNAKQLAAKVLQLRMKGKHEEADQLSKWRLVENQSASVEEPEKEKSSTSTLERKCHICCLRPSIYDYVRLILLQHEPATKTDDKNGLEEIHNFKKCFLKMFARQDKIVVFMETVISLVKQQRHGMIECIPVPCKRIKFQMQHEMKKLIPTSGNLRQVIPENFACFHVEFDDESKFSACFRLKVIRGVLRLPREDMHRRRRHESMNNQKQAVASFMRDLEPFNWTKQLK